MAQQEDILGLNPYLQRNRIGLVDEFFARFNGEKTHPSIPDTSKESRKRNLMMLFNLDLFKSNKDPYIAEASEMMDSVMAHNIKIHFSDTTWIALAHCVGELEGKTVKFDIQLKVQHRKKNMYKWVISKVGGKIFDIPARNNNELIMLYPDDHETQFMSLSRMTEEQPYNVERFMGKNVEYDITSVFAYLVYNKKLTINYVENLEFILCQIPGYTFHLQYFNRDKTNAGWLISKFYKNDAVNKTSNSREVDTKMETGELVGTRNNLMIGEGIIEGSINTEAQKRDIKNVFCARIDERLSQLYDYISFIYHQDSLDMRSIYISNKLVNLFSPNASINIKRENDVETTILSVFDFGKMLCDKSLNLQSLDSINVPVWDDSILYLDNTIEKHEFKSCKKSLKKDCLTGNNIGIPNEQKLLVYKIPTEIGEEWIPLLGNLFVTIKY